MLHWLDLLLLPADSLAKHVRERGDALGWGRPLAAEAAGLVAAFMSRAVSMQKQRGAEPEEDSLKGPPGSRARSSAADASEEASAKESQADGKEGTAGTTQRHERLAGEGSGGGPGPGPSELSQEDATVLLLCRKAVSVARAAGLTLGAMEELLPVSMQLPLLLLVALVGPHASAATTQADGESMPVPGSEAECDVWRWVLRAGMGTGCLSPDLVGPRSSGPHSGGPRGASSPAGAKAAVVSAEESSSMLDMDRVARLLGIPASRLHALNLGFHDWSTLISAVPGPSGALASLPLALPAGAPAAAAQRLRDMVMAGHPDGESGASGAILPMAAFEVAEYFFQQGDVQEALQMFGQSEVATSLGIAAGSLTQLDRPIGRGLQPVRSAVWIKATDLGRHCPETVSLPKVRGYVAACQVLSSAQTQPASDCPHFALMATEGRHSPRQAVSLGGPAALQEMQAAETLRLYAAGAHRPGINDAVPAIACIPPEARRGAAEDGHRQGQDEDGGWQDGGHEAPSEFVSKRRKLSLGVADSPGEAAAEPFTKMDRIARSLNEDERGPEEGGTWPVKAQMDLLQVLLTDTLAPRLPWHLRCFLQMDSGLPSRIRSQVAALNTLSPLLHREVGSTEVSRALCALVGAASSDALPAPKGTTWAQGLGTSWTRASTGSLVQVLSSLCPATQFWTTGSFASMAARDASWASSQSQLNAAAVNVLKELPERWQENKTTAVMSVLEATSKTLCWVEREAGHPRHILHRAAHPDGLPVSLPLAVSAEASSSAHGAGLLHSVQPHLGLPKYCSQSEATGALVAAQGLSLVDLALRLGRGANRQAEARLLLPTNCAADCMHVAPRVWRLAAECFKKAVGVLRRGEQVTTVPPLGAPQVAGSRRQERWQSDAMLLLRVQRSIADKSARREGSNQGETANPVLLKAKDGTHGRLPTPINLSLPEDSQVAKSPEVDSTATCNQEGTFPSEVAMELATVILLEHGLWRECKELGKEVIVIFKRAVSSSLGDDAVKLAARTAVLAYVLGSFMERSTCNSKFNGETASDKMHKPEHHEGPAATVESVGELLEGLGAALSIGSACPHTSDGIDTPVWTNTPSDDDDGVEATGCTLARNHAHRGTSIRLEAFSVRRQKQGAFQVHPHKQLQTISTNGGHSLPQPSPRELEALHAPTASWPPDFSTLPSLPLFSQLFNSCLLSTLAAALLRYLNHVQRNRASSSTFESLLGLHGPVALTAAAGSRPAAREAGSAAPVWDALLRDFSTGRRRQQVSEQTEGGRQSDTPHSCAGKVQPGTSAESHLPPATASGSAHGLSPPARALQVRNGSYEEQSTISIASALLDEIVRRQVSRRANVAGRDGPYLELAHTGALRPPFESAQVPDESSEAQATTDIQDRSPSPKAHDNPSVGKPWLPDPTIWLLTAAELKFGRGSHGEALQGYLKVAACNGGFFSAVYPRPNGKMPDHVIPSPWMLDRMLDCLKQCGAAVQGAVMCQMLPSPDIGTALLLLCKSGPIPDMTASTYFSFLWELVLLEQLAWRYQSLGKVRGAALLAAAMGQPQLNCHNPPSVHSAHVAITVCRFFRVLGHEYGAALLMKPTHEMANVI